MLKSRYGQGMNSADKAELDSILAEALEAVGPVYGDIIEYACADILAGDYSDALKYNAMNKTSWFRKYVQTYVNIKQQN